MKDKILTSAGFSEVSAIEMYSDIFKLGEHWIQERGEKPGLFKTNPIAVVGNGQRSRQVIMFEDEFEEQLESFRNCDWAYMSCLTYWGKRNISDAQSKMYAMVFDLDGVGDRRLANFLDGAMYGVYPMPNYVVMSGNGVHLYYVFEEPICLYPNVKQPLKELKYELTTLMWNEHTSNISRPQYQGINQGYRIPGTKAKKAGVYARAFKLGEHPVSLEYLNSFVDEEKRVDVANMRRSNRVSLDEAKALWPEWYQRRIIDKEPPKGWQASRRVYDWWKRKIFENAEYGHRYFCVMALAIYAVKCGVPEEEMRRDAYTFVDMLNGIRPENPFTETDVESALDCYDLRYIRFPRSDIAKLTGIDIPENKRNGRTSWGHLQAEYWEMGNGEEIPNPCKERREAGLEKARAEGRITGRPKGSGTKRVEVEDYFRKNPTATIAQAERELGFSHTTICKWKPCDE